MNMQTIPVVIEMRFNRFEESEVVARFGLLSVSAR